VLDVTVALLPEARQQRNVQIGGAHCAGSACDRVRPAAEMRYGAATNTGICRVVFAW
jgi:hypothetical protein